jgi:hypothetical protein
MEMDRADELAPRAMGEPSMSRLPEDTPHRDEILAAHKSALSKHEAVYLDPVTGLFASIRLTHGQIAHGREQGTHARPRRLANYLADRTASDVALVLGSE